MLKRSRLAEKKSGQIGPVPTILKPDRLTTGPKKCPKNEHSNIGLLGIWWVTVVLSDLRSLVFSGLNSYRHLTFNFWPLYFQVIKLFR
jgi:hypothetical protein